MSEAETKRRTRRLSDSPADRRTAAALLRAGELVAIPTETVYGLAANALDERAVERIFSAKGRPQDNPLIVHIASQEDWAPLVRSIPAEAACLAEACWPGPLTMILRRSALVPERVSAGLDTVAVRLPAHPTARALIQESGCPLAAPSANRSGSPSPTDANRVLEDMDGRIAAVVDGGPCQVGVESTVLDLTGVEAGGRPRLLRPGGVTAARLESLIGSVEIDPAVTGRLREGERAASPGMKYKHYAPAAHVILVRGTAEGYIAFVNKQAGPQDAALCFEEDCASLRTAFITYGRRDDPESQAHGLFDALRRLDEQRVRTAYAACPSVEGVGLAVYNRLLRAAGFETVDVQ